MANWYVGKGYGVSDVTDLTGRPLLTYQGPNDKKPFLLSDRVAQTFDFTVAQPLQAGAMRNARLDSPTSEFIKKKWGGGKDDELDHKISLELGGSNAPANLWIQHGITSGASAASDQLENSLALEVASGRLSLLSAWRTLAEQKGFLLGEDSKLGTTFSFSQSAGVIFDVVKNFVTGKKATGIQKASSIYKAQIQSDLSRLSQDPFNQNTMTDLFRTQVASISDQLKVTDKTSGQVIKSYLGAYAQSKGVDPREMLGSLNINIQRIIDNSKSNPSVFGIDSTTMLKITSAAEVGGGALLAIGIVLAIVGIVMVGPEVAAAAFSGGLLTAGFAALGISIPLGLGFLSFEVGGAITLLGIALNMAVKEVYDNGYLLPTQNISALKDALAVQKGLASFLPSAVTEGGSSSTPSTGGGGTSNKPITGGKTITQKKVSVVASGQELADLAQSAVADFLNNLESKFEYEIATKSNPIGPDGQPMPGKFIVARAYIIKGPYVKSHFEDLVLRELKEGEKMPAANDRVQIQKILNALATGGTNMPVLPATGQKQSATMPSDASNLPSATQTTPETQPTPTPGQTPQTPAPENIPLSQSGQYYKIGTDVYRTSDDHHLTLDEFQALGLNIVFIPEKPQPPAPVNSTYTKPGITTAMLSIDTFDLNGGIYHTLPDGSAELYQGPNSLPRTLPPPPPPPPPAPVYTPPPPPPPAPVYTPPPPPPPPAQPTYVRFAGSPNVFNRYTGQYISAAQAPSLGVFNAGAVQDFSYPRPEVHTGSDFALWDGKNLTHYPV